MSRLSSIIGGVALLWAGFIAPTTAMDLARLETLVAQVEESDNVTQLSAEGRRASDERRLQQSAAAGGTGITEPTAPARSASAIPPNEEVASPSIRARDMANRNGPLITDLPENPEDTLRDLLEDMDLGEGPNFINGRNIFVSLASSPVAIAPGRPGYITSRDIAFQTADLRARRSLAESIAQNISQQRMLTVTQNVEENAGPQEAARMASQGVAEDNLDAELARLGVDPSQYRGLPPEEKRVVFEQAYEREIISSASQLVMGASVIATAEGKINGHQTVAVAVINSEASATLANMALSSAEYASRTPPEDSMQRVRSRLPLRNGAQLAGYFGAQLINDGHGNYYVVGVGQAEYNPDHMGARDVAQRTAQLNANASVLTFITEQIDSESRSSVQQMMQRRDGDDELSVEQVQAFREQIRGRSEIQGLTGLMPLSTTQVEIDGVHAVIATSIWSPFSASFANNLRQRMQDAARPGSARERQAPPEGHAEPATGGARRSGAGDY